MKNLKFKSYYLFIVLLLSFQFVISITSCEDFLDKQPLDQLSTETFWQGETDAMLGLTGVYHCESLNEWEFWSRKTYHYLFECTTDNGFEKDDVMTDFNNGSMNSANPGISKLWKSSYRKILKCNNFLENIDRVSMDDAKKREMIAEVRTIRAYNYFYNQFFWGDVPLITKVLTVDEANSVSRNPRTDVVSFVIDELKDAIQDLPDERPSEEDGRITKGGALGILGRVQLAENKWTDAVNTYKQIMDMDLYSIDPRFKALFEEKGENSSEIVLKQKRLVDFYGESVLLSSLGFMWGGYHHFSPYNELVEEFECIDGKPINESNLYDIDNPYENRDPRLYKTFFIHELTKFKGQYWISHPDSNANVYPDQLTRRPWSGYGMFKYVDEDWTRDAFDYGSDFIMIRYAEILLSYLEANIEAGNMITQELLDQTINKIRGRAEIQMPPVTETNPEKLTTILRRERRVELAWEGLRLYDLFRWRIAHIKLRGRFHGMKLCSSEEAPAYTKFPVNENGYYFCEETNFRENVDYLWPIPQTERDINPNLTQNPGY